MSTATVASFVEEIRQHSTIHLVGDTSERNGVWNYWSLVPHGKTLPVYYRRPHNRAEGDGDETVLDLNAASRKLDTSVGLNLMRLSPNQDKLLYSLAIEGSDRATLFMRDFSAQSGAPRKPLRKTRIQAREEKRPLLDSPIQIEGVSSAVWLPDGSGFLYCCLDEKNRASTVRRRTLSAQGKGSEDVDTLVFEETSEDAYCDLTTSKDHRFITLNVNSRDRSRVFIVDFSSALSAVTAQCRLIEIPPEMFKRSASSDTPAEATADEDADDDDGHQFFLTSARGVLFAVTNIGHAPNYRVVATPLQKIIDSATPIDGAAIREGTVATLRATPAAVQWTVIVSNRSGDSDGTGTDVIVDDIELCGYASSSASFGGSEGWIVVFESRNDRPQVLVVPFPELEDLEAADHTQEHEQARLWDPVTQVPNGSYYLPLPEEEIVEVSGGANADPSSPVFHFTASSAISPPVDMCWDFQNQKLSVVAKREPLSASKPQVAFADSSTHRRALPPFSPQDFTSYRLFAPSWDGVNVPITVTHRRDILATTMAVSNAPSSAAVASMKSAEASVQSTRELSERVAECNDDWARRRKKLKQGTGTAVAVSPMAQILARCSAGWDDWRLEEPVAGDEGNAAEVEQGAAAYPLAHGVFPSGAGVSNSPPSLATEHAIAPIDRLTKAVEAYRSKQHEYDERFLAQDASSPSPLDEICALSAVDSKALQWAHDRRMWGYALEGYWQDLLAALGIRSTGSGLASSATFSPYYHRHEMLEREAAAASKLNLPPPRDYRHNNPLLLHMYGAYGISLPIGHDPSKLPLLQRGWTMAYGHIRGGGELGIRQWYHEGRASKKHNGFHDALACSRALIAFGYTRSNYMALSTESAGSVVGGYMANNFPYLFKAHYLRVPFLDVLTAISDPTLPLTVPEYTEWGQPAPHDVGDPIAAYIRRYSPLQNAPHATAGNVEGGKGSRIPSFIAVTAENDTRVNNAACEAFVKRWADYAGAPLILRKPAADSADNATAALPAPPLCVVVEQEGGHDGPSDTEGRMQASAEVCSLLYHGLGLSP